MMLFAEQRRSLALFICPEIRRWPAIHSVLPVEVQTEPNGAWSPAQFIDGVLHWIPAPMGKAEAARLEAMCEAYVRANHKVPAGIRSALAAASLQSGGEETRPASQAQDAEAIVFRQARQSWLLSEKAALAEHKPQLSAASNVLDTIHVQKFEQAGANAVDDLGIVSGSIKKDGIYHQLKRIDARRSILQRLNLFVRHVLLPLRLRKAKRGLDSAQAEPERDRA